MTAMGAKSCEDLSVEGQFWVIRVIPTIPAFPVRPDIVEKLVVAAAARS
jgi:hypothetical protein